MDTPATTIKDAYEEFWLYAESDEPIAELAADDEDAGAYEQFWERADADE